MLKIYFKYFVIIVILGCISSNIYSQKEKKLIRQGTKEYSDQKYGNAEVSYQKASTENPKSHPAKFNLGDALYKQEKYDQAIDHFSELSENNKNKKELASLNHNLGNSYLNKTAKYLKEQKTDSSLIEVNKSIEAYKKALKENPNDRETKYNLGYADRVKKMLEEQKKQQQNKDKNKKDQDKDNKDQDKNKQDQDKNKNKDKQNQDKNKQDQNKDKQNQDKNKQDQDKPDDSKQDSKDQKDNPQNAQKNQLSKDDALRLLNAIENDEKNVQDKLKKIKGKTVKVNEKDW